MLFIIVQNIIFMNTLYIVKHIIHFNMVYLKVVFQCGRKRGRKENTEELTGGEKKREEESG